MGEDKTWNPTLDPVHGPLSLTGSIDTFYFDRKNNEKWIKTEIVQK